MKTSWVTLLRWYFSLVYFQTFKLEVGLFFVSYKLEVLPVLNKQYKQINKNWFITRWEYKSGRFTVFIYAYCIWARYWLLRMDWNQLTFQLSHTLLCFMQVRAVFAIVKNLIISQDHKRSTSQSAFEIGRGWRKVVAKILIAF